MGLTKQYLRYAAAGNFNIVCSPRCNVVHVTLDGRVGRYVAAAACEHVYVWDTRTAERAAVLSADSVSEVTRLLFVPPHRLAAGYADGLLRIFRLDGGEPECVLAGHTARVTALAGDESEHALFSGAADNDIVVWDALAQRGRTRLSGHRAPVTDLRHCRARRHLVSASKDSTVKFWDLDSGHCFGTLAAHRAEVSACALALGDRYLVTGSAEPELRVWELRWREADLPLDGTTDTEQWPRCVPAGTLARGGRGRVVSLVVDDRGSTVACHGTDSTVELFRFRDDDETRSRYRRRLKKTKDESDAGPTLSDRVRRLPSVKTEGKAKGMDAVSGPTGELRLAVSSAVNTLGLYRVDAKTENPPARSPDGIGAQGHRTEVRCVAFSSDGLAVASGSSDSVKLWNRPSQTCLRTVPTGPVVSLCFAPGDRHLLAGLRDGRLSVVDASAGAVLEDVPAHESEIWSVSPSPDSSGVVTGGGDGTVKFWKFELVPDGTGDARTRVLSLIHERTLRLEEAVLCAKISPNNKFLAVGLLDSTVKIFFVDTLKFYLSLYGHKLPVLCLDISYDSALIATGSADRNIKIWGTDFGDCHRSIFAHDDSVTGLQFVPKTHYIFTSGKDGKIKQWDGDTFDRIDTLQGHVGEARGLSVAPSGLWCVSCGADRVLRLWERTEEPLVLGDTSEELEEELVTGERAALPGVPNLNMPSKRTVGSEKAAESILECLEACREFDARKAESDKSFRPPVLMQAYECSTPEDFFLKTVRRIRASDLEESLLILPFKAVCDIIRVLPKLLSRRDSCELVCRLTMFLVRVHHAAIVASLDLLNDLIVVRRLATVQMTALRDVIGYNTHALLWHQREIEVSEQEALFKDFTEERKKRNKKNKAREALKRSMIVLS